MNSTSVVLYFCLNFNTTCFFKLFINKLDTKLNSEKKYIYYWNIYLINILEDKRKEYEFTFEFYFFWNIIHNTYLLIFNITYLI